MKLPLFLKSKPKKKSFTKSADVDAFAYWEKIIIIFFSVALASLVFSITIMVLSAREHLVTKESRARVQALTSQSFRDEDLKQVINTFKVRAENRELILGDTNRVVSPAEYGKTE